MFATLACLEQHDLSLVAWALVVCGISVATSLSAYHRAVRASGAAQMAWIVAFALLMGSGVWATHFLAMLAYHPELSIDFDGQRTGLSLIGAIAGMAVGAALATGRRWPWRLAGGAICGASAGVMHFAGVAAARLPAYIVWDRGLLIQACVFGVVGYAAAFVAAERLTRPRPWFVAGGLIMLAVVGLHFSGMAAATLIPDGGAIVAESAYSRTEMAVAVVTLSLMILAAGAGLVGMDRINAGSTLATMRESLSCTPSPLAVYDADHRLVFWNDAYAAFMRVWAIEPQAGMSLRALLALSADGEPCDVTYARMIGSVGDAMAPFHAPDGRWRQPRLGRTVDGGLVHLLHDVTDEIQAREAAEAANRAKSEFLANMSHEIRTPLNAVLGLAHVMRAGGLEPKQAQRLDMIEAAGEALSTLCSNVLDLSSIEAGRMMYNESEFDLVALVDEAAQGAAAEAARKGLAFAVEFDPAAARRWRGDEGKVRRALRALLANAIKFTAAGRVVLRLTLQDDGLLIQVSDTGIGIREDQRDLIFQPFVQADASSTRPFGGAGLGLAVARRLVDLMGGRLDFTSTPGAGSTFAILLPMTAAAYAPRPAALAPSALKILAAEDNLANQMVLRAMLEPLGVKLAMTADGREAVAAFEHERFDVVLMDIQMPEMNGVDAAIEMRRNEAQCARGRTPILAVTANVSPEQVRTYLGVGMDGVVPKPIAAASLLEAVQGALLRGAAPEAGVIHAA